MYAIVRIIGNELPPRDTEGNRIKSLEFILNNEPEFDNCYKFWILNTIHRTELKCGLIDLIKSKGHSYHDFPFKVNEYHKAQNRDEKIRWAINVNAARNCGLDLFRDRARFIFLFDGDCFFTEDLWQQTILEMEEDNFSHKYYGVPGVRIVDRIPDNYHWMRSWEPSLVFRNDAELRFNEEVPFSKNDRIELMRRIGYQCQAGRAELHGDMCKNVGKLLHISFGDEDLALDMEMRIKAREESLDRLLEKIDHISLI